MIAAIVIAATLTTSAETTLVTKYGEAERARIHRGLQQVAEFWRPEDGDQAAFDEFVTTNFAGDPQTLDALFDRMQFTLESLDGHMAEISRDWKWQSDLDLGPIHPFDEIQAAYDPSAHVNDDLFQNKLAFVVLLNFPLTTLDERLNADSDPKYVPWSRRQWAETKLALRFSKRIPADVLTSYAKASADASQFVATYNIYMGHLTVGDFPGDLRLLEHWNLRDEIKAEYSLPQEQALTKQRVIQRVMERIIDASIPPQVVDNPNIDWNPFTNDLKAAPGKNRYDYILETFQAAKKVDPYSPTAPTHILRRFNEDRQIPEERVKQMLEQVMTSPLVPQVAKLIEKRLGRPLEPFDIWYNGFRPRGAYAEAQLDELVRKRYPTAAAYKADMPNLFRGLGFSPERAVYLAKNIEVDPARGSGHALPESRHGDNPHLRTRIGPNGMDYKGFNIAVHEMGHTVEEVFSLKDIDYYTLSGVPNTAFTEALAMIFQRHDLELLGLAQPTAENRALGVLDEFWNTYEISGVATVDMQMWHWMYDHPNATRDQLRDAVVEIAKDTWNKYYAPVFHKKDATLLAIYAHMVSDFMYLPDYPIGHMIAAQVEDRMEKAGTIGPEFERMARIGSVTPDQWMIRATGKAVGPQALLDETQRAMQQIQ